MEKLRPLLRNTVGLVLSLVLVACGSEDNQPNPYGPLGYGSCGAPVGNFLKKVTGNLGTGLLELQLFTSPDGNISGVGQLSIPNLSLFINPLGGGFQNGGLQSFGSNFNSCLTSNSPGRLEDMGPYQTIYLSLVGPNVQIQMGAGGNSQPYIRNDSLLGAAFINIAGYPADYWIMAD